MYSHSLLKSKKLNSCLKIVFYNVILTSKKKKIIIIKMCYNVKKEYTEMINMKKLFLIVILALTTVSCELFDSNSWDRARQKAADRGRTCYRYSSGYVHCEDADGNNY